MKRRLLLPWTWFRSSTRTRSVILLKETSPATADYHEGQRVGRQANYLKFAREGYQSNPYIFRCVSLKAKGIGSLKWYVRRLKGEEEEQLFAHPALEPLRRPNPLQGGTSFFKSVSGFFDIAGNSYIYGIRPRPGMPFRELWPLRPDKMTVVTGDSANPIAGYEYETATGKKKFAAEDVLHWRTFNPLSSIYGQAPIQAAALSVDQNNAGRLWNKSLVENGGRVDGAWIMRDSMDGDDFDETKENLQEQYDGPANAGKRIFVTGDVTWQETSISPKDADWIEGIRNSAKESALVYDVPPELIGDPEVKQFANHQAALKSLWENNLGPEADELRDELNRWYMPAFQRPGEILLLDWDRMAVPALREDRDSLFKRAQDSKFLSVNEKRALVGFDEWPGGDVILMPLTEVPFGSPREEAEVRAALPDNGRGAIVAMHKDRSIEVILPGVPPSIGERQAREVPAEDTKELRPINLPPDLVEPYLKTLDTRREAMIAKTTAVIEGLFDGDRKAVKGATVDAQTETDLQGGAFGAIDSRAEQWVSAYSGGIYTPVVDMFAGDVFRGLKAQSGEPERKQDDPEEIFDYEAARAQWLIETELYLSDFVGSRVKGIADVTKNRIGRIIDQGIEAGKSIPQIRDDIDELFLDEIIPNRSTVIARTETINASNFGSRAGAKATGLPLVKEWVATKDGRTRGADPGDDFNHRVADGQKVDFDSLYTVSGEQLMFPTDFLHGASGGNTINCRCTEVYEVKS